MIGWLPFAPPTYSFLLSLLLPQTPWMCNSKKRLLGAIIILGSAVAFLPMLLDGSGEIAQNINVNFQKPDLSRLQSFAESSQQLIDTVPEVIDGKRRIALPLGQSGLNTDNLTPKTVLLTPDSLDTTTDTTPNPTITRPPLNAPSWVLQVGAFLNRSNADSLIARLSQQGFQAFVKPTESGDKIFFIVFVGPDSDKANLEQKAQRLQTLLSLEGTIRRHSNL